MASLDARRIAVAAALGTLAIAAVLASIKLAPGAPGLLGAALALIALAIAAIDARWFVIPNELNAAGFALGLINAAVLAPDAIWEAVGLGALRGAALALAFLGLRALYRRWRGREGLGLGDVKLAAVAGAWLDWATLPIVIEIAALAALAAFGFRLYLLRKPVTTALKFPFGLFLAPAIWVGWVVETGWMG